MCWKKPGIRPYPSTTVLFNKNLPFWKVLIDRTLAVPGSRQKFQNNEIYELKYLRVKIVELLMWLTYRVGSKSKLYLLQCPLCTAHFFMIDGYLYCMLDTAANSISATLKLDLDISDAVITCRHCGEEIEIKDAAIELMKLIASSGAQWMRM
jgi:Zn finger protein HypA/HybF involved in hydrogenase expression